MAPPLSRPHVPVSFGFPISRKTWPPTTATGVPLACVVLSPRMPPAPQQYAPPAAVSPQEEVAPATMEAKTIPPWTGAGERTHPPGDPVLLANVQGDAPVEPVCIH